MNKNSKKADIDSKLPITKQTAGGVTGAVLGGMIAGPVGAIIGGVAGAMMGNRVEHGKPAIPEGAVAAAESMARKVQKSAGAKKIKALASQALEKAHTAEQAVVKKVTKQVTAAKKVPSKVKAKEKAKIAPTKSAKKKK